MIVIEHPSVSSNPSSPAVMVSIVKHALSAMSIDEGPSPKYRMRACDRAKHRRRGGKV